MSAPQKRRLASLQAISGLPLEGSDRAPKAATVRSREPVPDLETAVKSGNIENMMASFLAALPGDNDPRYDHV